MKKFAILLTSLCPLLPLEAEVVEKEVKYEHEGVVLEGFHAFDDELEGKRPGVLIIHQWTGLTDYEKMRARMLAELGYNVFAADIYGAGVRPQPPEAGEVAGKYKGDRALYRARMLAGLDVLKKDERTDGARIAAIGYCFGGTGVLELARAGTPLQGVVSFHGGLAAAEGMEAKEGKIPAKVLCLHGAIDPYVPPAEVDAFRKEMTDAKADWQLLMYGGAVHAFTQKMAGDDISKGAAYDAKADERSWEDMQQFFAEIFGESSIQKNKMHDLFEWPSFLREFSRAAEEKNFHSEVILETEDGPLMAWEQVGEGPPIYLSAGIHGDEPAGPLAALRLMESGAFPVSRHCIVCPALNPGGLAIHTRENRSGTDLNRDYLLQTSLEVSAHARWLTRRPSPGLFISLHEDWESDGFYFYEINLGEDRPERADALLSAVSPYFPPEQGPEIDGHDIRSPGWIFHSAEADLPDSWPEAIYLAKRGCPLSFTFETPSTAELADRVDAHVAGFVSLLAALK